MNHTQECLDSKEKFREALLVYKAGKITAQAVEASERESRRCPACRAKIISALFSDVEKTQTGL